jgi:diphthamide biosynthesis protein 2
MDKIDRWKISEIVARINSRGFKHVTLQFNDDFLKFSFKIYSLLKKELPSCQFYVLGDSSYSPCCIDEVGASHVDSKFVVQFGHSCMSVPKRLSIFNVFDELSIDIDQCVSSLVKVISPNDSVFLTGELCMENHLCQIVERLKCKYFDVSFIPFQEILRKESLDLIYFVGGQASLDRLLKTFPSAVVFSFDPFKDISGNHDVARFKFINQRFLMCEKIKIARTVAIVLASVGVERDRDMVDWLKKILTESMKRVYVLSIGKLNPEKIANFLGVDVFCVVGCPENSFFDSKAYLNPIVTPFEVEMALFEKDWAFQKYKTTFDEFLKDRPLDSVKARKEPFFSLATGKYVWSNRSVDKLGQNVDFNMPEDLKVINIYPSEGTVFRHWNGLDSFKKPVSNIKEGRKGAASYYGEL